MRYIIILVLFLVVEACTPEDDDKPTVTTTNKPPVANAGPDSTIYYPDLTSYRLNGKGNYEPDLPLRRLEFAWKQLSGPSVVINEPASASTSFGIQDTGVYVFSLRVSDNLSAFSIDTLAITVRWGLSCNQSLQPGTVGYEEEFQFPDVMPSGYAMASSDEILVFAGGNYSTGYVSPNLWVYNMNSKTIEKRTLPVARTGIGLAVSDRWVVSAGGHYPGSGEPVDNVELYNLSTRETRMLKLSLARSGIKVVIHGDIILFAGGWTYNGASSVVDIYDTRNGNWTQNQLSVGRLDMAAAVSGSEVFFTGGYELADIGNNVWGNPHQASNVIDIFNTQTGAWKTRRLTKSRAGHSAIVTGDNLILSGGWANTDYKEKTIEVLDLSNNNSSTICHLPSYSWDMNYHMTAALTGQRSYYYLANGFLSKWDLDSGNWTLAKQSNNAWVVNLIGAGNKLLGLRFLGEQQTADGTGQKLGLVRLQL